MNRLVGIILGVLVYCIFALSNCDNPTSSEKDKEIGSVSFNIYDSTHSLEDNKFPIIIENTISYKKCWKKTIEIDTSEYFIDWALFIEEITSSTGHTGRIKTACFMDSNIPKFNYNLLLKQNQNSSKKSKITICIFFIGKGTIEEEINDYLYLRKKNGEVETIEIYIKNPNKYLISYEDANTVLQKEDIINSSILDQDINRIQVSGEYNSEDLDDNFFVVNISKFNNIENATQSFTWNWISTLGQRRNYGINRNEFDLSHYVFVFKK